MGATPCPAEHRRLSRIHAPILGGPGQSGRGGQDRIDTGRQGQQPATVDIEVVDRQPPARAPAANSAIANSQAGTENP